MVISCTNGTWEIAFYSYRLWNGVINFLSMYNYSVALSPFVNSSFCTQHSVPILVFVPPMAPWSLQSGLLFSFCKQAELVTWFIY